MNRIIDVNCFKIALTNYFVCTNRLTVYDKEYDHYFSIGCDMLYLVKINYDVDTGKNFFEIKKSAQIVGSFIFCDTYDEIISADNNYYIRAINLKNTREKYIFIWDIVNNKIKYLKIAIEHSSFKIALSPNNKYLCVLTNNDNIYIYDIEEILINTFDKDNKNNKDNKENKDIYDNPVIFQVNLSENYSFKPYYLSFSNISMTNEVINIYSYMIGYFQSYNFKTNKYNTYTDVDYLSSDNSFIVQYFNHGKMVNLITGEEKIINKKNIQKREHDVCIFDDENIFLQLDFSKEYYPMKKEQENENQTYRAFDLVTGEEKESVCYKFNNKNYQLFKIAEKFIKTDNNLYIIFTKEKDRSVYVMSIPEINNISISMQSIILFNNHIDLHAIYNFIPSIRVLATSGNRQFPKYLANLVIVNIIEQLLITNGYKKNISQAADVIYKYLIKNTTMQQLQQKLFYILG